MKVIVCSAEDSLRQRWKKILEKEYQIMESDSVNNLKTALEKESAGLILLHRSMVDLEFISKIRETCFLVLADVPQDEEAVTVLRMGAFGYANSYTSPPLLLEAVKSALSGRVWIGRSLLQKIIRGTSAVREKADGTVSAAVVLSDREFEVAEHVSSGLSNHEIGFELGISERTVKAHIGAIFKKTNTTSRLQLALYMKGELGT